MMPTPTPIDINKLRGILDKSRAIMDKVETENPKVLSERTYRETAHEEAEDTYEPPVRGYNEDMVRNSGLPDAIKNIMINRPIPTLTGLPSKFTAEELYNESDEKEIPMNFKKKQSQVRKPLNEAPARQYNSDTITISKSELKNMINEQLLEFFTQSYNKRITEDAIKRTIKTLISEGKIVQKKRTI